MGYILDQVWFVALSNCFSPTHPHQNIILCCFRYLILQEPHSCFSPFAYDPSFQRIVAHLEHDLFLSDYLTTASPAPRADSDKSHTFPCPVIHLLVCFWGFILIFLCLLLLQLAGDCDNHQTWLQRSPHKIHGATA